MRTKNVKNRLRLANDCLEKAYSHILCAKQISDNYFDLVHFQEQMDTIANVISNLKQPAPAIEIVSHD